jgi:hypothetical protein
VLGYLARYTHRVAITNHRRLAFDQDQVTFRWKDYAHGNKKRIMTLGSQEFLRRFLPRALSASALSASSPIAGTPLSCRSVSACSPTVPRRTHLQPSLLPLPKPTCFRCPKCSTPMLIIERFSVTTAGQLSTRSAYLDSS